MHIIAEQQQFSTQNKRFAYSRQALALLFHLLQVI
jgi:hypothetical protein